MKTRPAPLYASLLTCALIWGCEGREATMSDPDLADAGVTLLEDSGVGGVGERSDMEWGGANGATGGSMAGMIDPGVGEGGEISAPPEPTPEELIIALSARGPHPVGYQTEELTYTVPSRGDERSLKLAWWFPAEGEGGLPAPYGGGADTRFAQRELPVLSTLTDAPVLIFSHGNGGIAEQSYFLTEHFASHGWVVLSVEHTGNTLTNQSEPLYWLFELRPLDIHAALEHLGDLPSEHPLAGHVSDSSWAMSGHSFGGYTTLALGGATFNLDVVLSLCERPNPDQEEGCAYSRDASERYLAGFGDPRLKALIPMTPAGANLFSGGQGLGSISAPTLLMTAALDATLPNVQEGDPLWSGLTRADSVRIDFDRAGHFTFSNACEVASSLLDGDGCGARFIPYAEAHSLIKLYALAFARQHVLGDPLLGPITRGELVPDSAVDQLTFSLRE